mmetsp:Transcript_16841/g.41028  ORF Transcript_16841/g.41028 Transcript_16841/m.41028 type:complete len:116 (+) Transcript_16841:294-641(+)
MIVRVSNFELNESGKEHQIMMCSTLKWLLRIATTGILISLHSFGYSENQNELIQHKPKLRNRSTLHMASKWYAYYDAPFRPSGFDCEEFDFEESRLEPTTMGIFSPSSSNWKCDV